MSRRVSIYTRAVRANQRYDEVVDALQELRDAAKPLIEAYDYDSLPSAHDAIANADEILRKAEDVSR